MTSHTTRLSMLALLVFISAPALAGDVSVTLDAGAGFSVKNSTGAIERLRVDEATGNISRNGALFLHTTGTTNTFVGAGAGNPATTGAGLNSAFGRSALGSLTTGVSNDAFGDSALTSNSTGSRNAAFGVQALRNNTSGSYNVAVGSYALRANTTGTGNTAVGQAALLTSATGLDNSAFGAVALRANTTGTMNSAFGRSALYNNGTGGYNSALGARALFANTTGARNSAIGHEALFANTGGRENAALGDLALRSNTTGSYNAAIGRYALAFNTAGSQNIAVGWAAGSSQTTGYNNIYIGNFGAAGESGQIKIGSSGIHTQATISGIHGRTSSGGIAVLVNASGVLGTTTSSARFKQDVRDMGEASDVLMKLRPVTFRYREDAVGAEDAQTTQYGLIAEEVAEVAPELVAQDLDGKPYSVKYHELPALLLNELQKSERRNSEQERRIERQDQVIAALQARLTEVERRGHDGARQEVTR